MTKKYTLTTSEETVTENPEDIIRLMKLAGLSNAQAVAEEEVNEDVYEPTEANDELDLDDYSKKSPESISKQKKSIQPSHGDNPLEYSLDENEIYEAMMKEFNEIEEGKLPPGLQAYQDKKNGKKDEAVEETVEETDESIEESKPDFLDLDKDGDKEESMKKAAKDKKEKADESLDEATEGCADCEYMKDETDGEIDTCDECAAEERENANEETVTEDASVWSDFKKAHAVMDDDSEDRMFFSLKNWSGHRFEIQSDIEGENGTVVLGMHTANQDGETEFLQNRKFALSDIEANITGAGWYADGGTVLKTTIGDFTGMDMEEEEVTEPNESSDMDRLRKLSGM